LEILVESNLVVAVIPEPSLIVTSFRSNVVELKKLSADFHTAIKEY